MNKSSKIDHPKRVGRRRLVFLLLLLLLLLLKRKDDGDEEDWRCHGHEEVVEGVEGWV